jgi:predicted nucleic acid-binding protein
VKFFFDTSVLVPCFFENHIHHEASLRAFLRVDNSEEGCCAAHSLVEVYATATRLPVKHRVSGEQVLLFLDNVRERLEIVSLTPDEYYSTLSASAAAGIVGGTVYDALLGRCAVKANAEFIYTWNVKHFQQLSPDIASRLRTP